MSGSDCDLSYCECVSDLKLKVNELEQENNELWNDLAVQVKYKECLIEAESLLDTVFDLSSGPELKSDWLERRHKLYRKIIEL